MIEVCEFQEYAEHNPTPKKVANYFRVDGGVYFSATRKGSGIEIHIASKRKHKPKLRKSVNRFCKFLFENYDWCRMIIATISHENKSVKNLAKKCDFKHIGDSPEANCSVYIRSREDELHT